jgi:hypothetical protein
MIGRLTARLAAPRAGNARRLSALPAALLLVLLGVAVPALAATAAGTAAGTAVGTAAARNVTLRTLVRNVNVRTDPRLSARVTGHLGKKGSKVVINCFSTGSQVAGNPVWYHVLRPTRGYVTSYYLSSHYDPVAGLRQCRASGFRRVYWTIVDGLHIRELPTPFSRRLATLGRMGGTVVVTCWTYGQSINGNPVWYRTASPRHGYVAGQHLDTGRDPANGVPRCR